MPYKRPAFMLGLGNAFATLLAISWAYTSIQCDWINVGGRVGDYDFWDAANGAAFYALLTIWLLAILLTVVLGFKFKTNGWQLIGAVVLTVFLAPVAAYVANWFFHLGFPPSPPL